MSEPAHRTTLRATNGADQVTIPDTFGIFSPSGAYATLSALLARLRALHPRPPTVVSIEAVHRLRVTTRRLRVAIRALADLLPPRAAKRHRRELKRFAKQLGEARDLDVFAKALHSYRKRLPPEERAGLRGYARHLRHARRTARARLVATLSDARRTALLTELHAMLAATLPSTRASDIGAIASKRLPRSLRRVRKLGRKLAKKPSSDGLHDLRIDVKRLRYELELFASVSPDVATVAHAAKDLQDILGKHQDACAASAHLREYSRRLRAAAGSKPERRALKLLRKRLDRKAARARERFATQWTRFERAVDRRALPD
jgi:CHAD domain-containing protein